MADFGLSIKCDNAAFDDYPGWEVARILRALANVIEEGGLVEQGGYFNLYDVNGNRVGQADYYEEGVIE